MIGHHTLRQVDLLVLADHIRFCPTCQEVCGQSDLSPTSDSQIDLTRIVPPSPSVTLEWEINIYDDVLIRDGVELPSQRYDPSPEAQDFMARRRVAEKVRREIRKIRNENPEITFYAGDIPMKIITHSRSLLLARLRVMTLRGEFESLCRPGVEI